MRSPKALQFSYALCMPLLESYPSVALMTHSECPVMRRLRLVSTVDRFGSMLISESLRVTLPVRKSPAGLDGCCRRR